MNALDVFWLIGEAVSALVLLAGVFLTLMPVESTIRWFRLEHGPPAGPAAYPRCSACHATCTRYRHVECHPPCNHRLFLEAEW